METEVRHQCLIYDGEPWKKVPSLMSSMLRKRDEGFRCLYLNSPTMVAAMRACLHMSGVDVDDEVAKGRLVLATETPFGDKPFDMDVMLDTLETALDQSLNDGYKGLWASGDMTYEFGPQRDFAQLMEYELRLEKLFHRRHELCGICQYHRDTLPPEAMRHGLLAHRKVFVNETLSQVNPHYAQSVLSSQEGGTTYPELDKMIFALCQLESAVPDIAPA